MSVLSNLQSQNIGSKSGSQKIETSATITMMRSIAAVLVFTLTNLCTLVHGQQRGVVSLTSIAEVSIHCLALVVCSLATSISMRHFFITFVCIVNSTAATSLERKEEKEEIQVNR